MMAHQNMMAGSLNTVSVASEQTGTMICLDKQVFVSQTLSDYHGG